MAEEGEATSERGTQMVTKTYPLNLRRLTAHNIERIMKELGLPTTATLADARQIIEGKLIEESRELRNVEVILIETERGTTIRLKDDGRGPGARHLTRAQLATVAMRLSIMTLRVMVPSMKRGEMLRTTSTKLGLILACWRSYCGVGCGTLNLSQRWRGYSESPGVLFHNWLPALQRAAEWNG